MKSAVLVSILIGAVLISACDHSNQSDSTNFAVEQKALNDHMALWQRSNFASYQYVFRKQCFCGPLDDIVVVVLNGQVSQAYHLMSGIYLSAQELAYVLSIEQLFSTIQDAIDRKAFKLNVTYDPQLGFPQFISIDYSQNVADDEIAYTARNVQ